MTHSNPKANIVPKAVLTRSGPVLVNAAKQNLSKPAALVNTAKPINTAAIRPKVNATNKMPNTFKKAHSHGKRPFNNSTAKQNSYYTHRVNTVRGSRVNTARHTVKNARPTAAVNAARSRVAVKSARPKAVLKAVRGNLGNDVKASAYWVWRPKHKVIDHGNPELKLKERGIFDSGCSRHMTRNKSDLTDFEEIDGGFVAFGGNSRGGKITWKGTIKTGNLDFDDVYFVKELKFNLLSVSQMCDKKNSVLFTDTECFVLSSDFKLADENQVLLKVPRRDNMYSVDLKNIVPKRGLTCLYAKATSDEAILWHRRLGHVNFKTINKLVKGNLVRDLPSKTFEINQTCVACQKGKQHRASCKAKAVSSICQPLQMLHMDLFGPTFVKSLMKKPYCLVVTDDFSRFTWVFFLATKDEIAGILKSFIIGIENLIDLKVKIIRSDNGTEFKNRIMNEFCVMKGIRREYSVARTLQQNGVAERKNRTLIEAARTMLADSKLPITFWAEAVNTACYVQNRVLVVKPYNKTPYELFLGRKPALGFMRPFRCPVTILNTLDHLGKFDCKADEGFFVGYSTNSKAFRVFNSRTRIVEENLHPVFAGNQTNGSAGTKAYQDVVSSQAKTFPDNKDDKKDDDQQGDQGQEDSDDKVDKEEEEVVNSINILNAANAKEVNAAGEKAGLELPHDPDMPELEDIVYSDGEDDVGAEADITNLDSNILVSPIPTTRIHKDHPLDQVIGDVHSVWTLVDLPNGKRAIGTKWVYRNKKDERGIVVRNKARLVAQGHTQEEGIDYDEVFSPVARNEAIRLFLAYASYMDFTVYQMDVKSAFLYGTIEEEVYVCQPPGFEDPQFPDKGYKVEKALYSLHQAPRACHDKYVAKILKKFDFSLVKTASTPMEPNKVLVKDSEAEDIDVYLYRSMIGLLMYLTASRPDIMFAPKLGLWYPKDSPFDLEAYSDSDYAGASLDRKSTTGGCQFLGKRLISWQCKKQTIVANSTTEAEYVAAVNCCGQVLWIQNQMLDYGFNFLKTKIYIDNESTICIVKNPVFHSKTKHIEIRHHFIRDSYEKRLIEVLKIHTDHNVADLLTKGFDVSSELVNIIVFEAVYKEMYDSVERAATTATCLEAEQDSCGRPRCQEAMGDIHAQTRFESVSKSYDSPL
ncbi:putative ribonuclease H-like domain-containing protein [Tanacetum coccineum]|uniref:Ribonuclease H-like domain-containing protein n=1 Tax=Tanacetum coccineum TaxID=301880 RepID=A0ABQ5DL61_9ASTR